MKAISPTEMKVLRLLVRTGGSNKEIARQLGIVDHTVKLHMKKLFAAAGVDNRVKLVLWAQHEGVQS